VSNTSGEICFDSSQYIVYQPYRGLHLAYHAKKFHYSGRSRYQQIDIIDNEAYGRMLFLDHNLQHTAYDAAIFNEALCGMAKQSRIRSSIVLGGGSGQTLLTLLRIKSTRHATVVEVDPLLIQCCKRYIKGVNAAFSDPRVKVRIGDAFTYLHSTAEQFDAAIIDLTERPFHMRARSTLKQVYADVRAKCNGRCSQYLGSSVDLASTHSLSDLACELARKTLSKVRVEQVFVPSFGAPHKFLHAGYEA